MMTLAPEAIDLLADIATLQTALAGLIETIDRAETNIMLADLCADPAFDPERSMEAGR